MELAQNFQYSFWRQITLFYVTRGISGNHAIRKIEIYAEQVYGWNTLTTGLKIFILDVALFPDPPLVNISLPHMSDKVENQVRLLCKLYLMIACSETHFNIDSNKINNCRLSVYFSFQIMKVFFKFIMFNSTVGQDNLYLLLLEIRAETSNH